ncbi:MAG: YrhB domain-containing protein [Candidatus Sericytochromatia bacterium]
MSPHGSLSRSQAEDLVQRYLLANFSPEWGFEPLVDREQTCETSFGWGICWNSAAYLRSRDDNDSLYGNAPVLCSRDGRLWLTGTGAPLEVYVKRLEARLGGGESLWSRLKWGYEGLFRQVEIQQVPQPVVDRLLP